MHMTFCWLVSRQAHGVDMAEKDSLKSQPNLNEACE